MTVGELLSEAVRLVAEKGIRQDPLSRVSEMPDLRAFRLYRAEGLIDRPVGKQGAAGVYGRKHLLQLVAIKALQARRLPLREIRKTLASAGESEMNGLIDGSGDDRVSQPKTKRAASGPANRDRRWIQVCLTEDAFAWVDEQFVNSARPSSFRALGEQLASSLQSCRI
jgi:DNA-binding transcriptional MerR regulator